MALYDEEEVRKKQEKNTLLRKGIITGIVLSAILIVILMLVIAYLIRNPNKITIYVGERENTKLESLVKTKKTDEGTILYFPIKQTAEIFGFQTSDGEYSTNYEDSNSCNIQTSDEVTVFNMDSNIIYKTDPKDANLEYEAIKIQNPIIKIEDELYINSSDLNNALNMSVSAFNEKTKRIKIITLDTLVETAQKVATDSGYEKMDDKFMNKKAVLDNMIVVQNKDRKYGVIDGNGKIILNMQYDDITYIPQKKSFFVEKGGKVGIYGKNVKIDPNYAELKLIDADNELYLVKNANNQYGVIDITGETKIYSEYDKIGVDINNFKRDGVKSGYVLVGNLIPVQQNGKWKFFKIESTTNSDGVKIVQCKNVGIEFDDIGCVSKTTGSTVSNVLTIEDYGVVVVKKNNLYGIMDANGNPSVALICLDIYKEITSGKTNYYMIDARDGKTYIIEKEADKIKHTEIKR